tara:strand:+ start:143 stop:382 length:240 start_codon:yes stop_codon:yes gene_type:complete
MINQLLNQEVRVKVGSFTGQTGIVTGVMSDDRSLDVKLSSGKRVFLDYTFVEEIQERTAYPKTPQSLGPIANSVIKDTV